MDFSYASRNDLTELLTLFQVTTQSMNEHNIFQWDEIYPDRQILLEDIEHGIMEIGRVADQIAVAFALEECAAGDYEGADWRYPAERIIVLHRLCVHPAFQRQGIARAAMDYLEQRVRERGISTIRLDAFSQNPAALKLYEARGYEKAGDIVYRKGLFYLYEKKL